MERGRDREGHERMPAGGGRLALSVSRAMMTAARVTVGDVTEFEITDVGRS